MWLTLKSSFTEFSNEFPFTSPVKSKKEVAVSTIWCCCCKFMVNRSHCEHKSKRTK